MSSYSMNWVTKIHWHFIGRHKFEYVGYIHSRTIWVDENQEPTGNEALHNYSLFESGLGKRKVQVVSEYPKSARDHPFYTELVIPWVNGHRTYEFTQNFIPVRPNIETSKHLTVVK